jgi:hypothetical protein
MLIKSQSKIPSIDKLVEWFIITHHCLVAIKCNGLLWYNVTRQIEINWYDNIWYMWYNIWQHVTNPSCSSVSQRWRLKASRSMSGWTCRTWPRHHGMNENMHCPRNMHVLCRFYGNVMRNTSFDAYLWLCSILCFFSLMVQWDVFVCFSKIFECVCRGLDPFWPANMWICHKHRIKAAKLSCFQPIWRTCLACFSVFDLTLIG